MMQSLYQNKFPNVCRISIAFMKIFSRESYDFLTMPITALPPYSKLQYILLIDNINPN